MVAASYGLDRKKIMKDFPKQYLVSLGMSVKRY